ncbi:unnamed protein product [Tetraodon nigroviridis]|uniref:(spotted green pufferfish) hypothetical protein n=1 Tax=Tetraodon nigroviridis TaxID=99883 RepID=Q4RTE8_TETNG|nr:unnamed protein product [Tetraodon nigroviridis]
MLRVRGDTTGSRVATGVKPSLFSGKRLKLQRKLS